jgi:WD40 repeat protein
MTGHTSNVLEIVQINANQVATSSNDSTLRVWDINTGSLINTYFGHTSNVKALTVLPNGLLVTGSDDKTMRLWNMQTQTVTVMTAPGLVRALMFNPTIGSNGTLVASVMNYGLSFVDAATLIQVQGQNLSRTYESMDMLQPSGNVICGYQYLDVYNTTGSLVYSFDYKSSVINKIKPLPDNVTVAIGFTNGSIGLFNSNTSTFGDTMDAHNDNICLLSLTPDFLYVMSGGLDSQLILWTWSTMNLKLVRIFSLSEPVCVGLIISTNLKGILCKNNSAIV